MKIFALMGMAAMAIQPAAAQAPRDSRVIVRQPGAAYPAPRPLQSRWGPRENGRWYAGARAPGGWKSYRRPINGYVVPRYWIAPNYYIGDWNRYGFATPRAGLAWSRYYDDAVLIDGNGRVYDSVYGVDWDRYDGGYDPRYTGYGYENDGYDYPDAVPRRDDGVGGALIGGAVGAVAGNVIAGRGSRTEGTLIGAGVGALAGLAIDKAEDSGKNFKPYPVPQGGAVYGADDGYSGDRVVVVPPQRESRWLARSVPRTTVVAPSATPQVIQQQGYYANGYYYPAPVTLIIQPGVAETYVEEEPVEYVEEVIEEPAAPVRVSRALPKAVARPAPKKVWRALPKTSPTRTVKRCVC